MLSNHLILCHPLLLLPSIFPSIRVFSSESVLHIRWPKYWSFSFSISPSNEYSELISFRMDWISLQYKGLSRVFSSPTTGKYEFFGAQPSHGLTLTSVHDYWKNHSFDCLDLWASLVAQMVKNLPAVQETWVQFLGWEDLLEKGMATHSSIFAWRIPWTEEPGRLQSMGLQRVRHD